MSAIIKMLRTSITTATATILALTMLTAVARSDVTHSGDFSLAASPGDSHWTVTMTHQQ